MKCWTKLSQQKPYGNRTEVAPGNLSAKVGNVLDSDKYKISQHFRSDPSRMRESGTHRRNEYSSYGWQARSLVHTSILSELVDS